MPTPRYAHVAVTIGNFIIVIGGYERIYNGSVSSTLIYNVKEKKWSEGPSMATARAGHIAATINGNKVVIAGGEKNLNTAEMITFNLNGTRR